MRKVFFTILCTIMSIVGASAQKGATTVGVNVNYGSEIKTIGFAAKVGYNITDAFRTEASYNHFLKKDGVQMWDANLNFHYLFNITDKFKAYPLVGVTYVHSKLDWQSLGDFDDYEDYLDWKSELEEEGGSVSDGTGKVGVNLGGGLQYNLTNNLLLNFEVKYSLVKDLDQCVIGLGLAYRF